MCRSPSTFILVSQNHAARTGERHRPLDLQIQLPAEQENTQMLQRLDRIEPSMRSYKLAQRIDKAASDKAWADKPQSRPPALDEAPSIPAVFVTADHRVVPLSSRASGQSGRR
ncbi:hypothetical protein [Rhizobacter sp. P5_C2]